MHDTEIVGRDQELQTISLFLEHRDAPSALLIRGDAGIGKTTLWRWGADRAAEQGRLVLTARPAASEARLAFAAIADLLGGVVDPVMSRLPQPQQRALAVALLLEDPTGRPPDARMVAVAVLGVLRPLAAESPLLLAVDDVQWLDRPSAEVLSFVARRLDNDPVGLLLAQRSDKADGVPLGLDRAFGDGLRRVEPRPLSLGATHRLLRSNLGLTLPRPVLRRVHTACGGNPLFALEIGRVIEERPGMIPANQPLPVPSDVKQLLVRRIKRLSRPSRAAVLAAALLAEPSANVVEQAADSPGLEEAMAAGLLVADGDGLRFSHPLFAEAAVSLTPGTRRRDMHLRLAALLEDPEAQAQHLALGTSAPDADIAHRLDRAADVARRRGATASAAAFAEHAARLTPGGDIDAFARRTIDSASWWWDAGDMRRCRALVEPLLSKLPAGELRVEALSLKAGANPDRRAYRRGVEEALAEAEGYPSHQVELLLQLSHALIHAQEFDAARARARQGVDLAERTGNGTLMVEALSWAGRLEVGSSGLELLHRARDLERGIDAFNPYESPLTWLGRWLLANDELEPARQLLERQHHRAIDDGQDWSRMWLQWPMTELECKAGNYEAARAYAEDAAEIAEAGDSPYALSMTLYCRALAAAHAGETEAARDHAQKSLSNAAAIHSKLFTVGPRIALAFVAVSEGDYPDAREHLAGLTEVALNGPYWATYPFWGDLFEVLVSLGELERAQSVLADLEAHRHVVVRPGTAPVLARCRGLVLAASGSPDEAIASLEESLRFQQTYPAPLERARTLLALGEMQRRARRRRAARETLTQALGGFESLGATLWAQRARAELARIGGRAPSGEELTPSERRIAELVAEGKTNKEVAAILVVADRTVESALTQIYRKLDVRSRTELARRIAPRA